MINDIHALQRGANCSAIEKIRLQVRDAVEGCSLRTRISIYHHDFNASAVQGRYEMSSYKTCSTGYKSTHCAGYSMTCKFVTTRPMSCCVGARGSGLQAKINQREHNTVVLPTREANDRPESICPRQIPMNSLQILKFCRANPGTEDPPASGG